MNSSTVGGISACPEYPGKDIGHGTDPHSLMADRTKVGNGFCLQNGSNAAVQRKPSLSSYSELLREIVREHGDPRTFNANAVRLTDAQLAVAMARYDDALPEVAGEIAESVASCLSGDSSFGQMFRSPAEAIGVALIAGCRARLLPTVRNDLACMASDMEMEDADDAEFA